MKNYTIVSSQIQSNTGTKANVYILQILNLYKIQVLCTQEAQAIKTLINAITQAVLNCTG